MKRVIIDKYGYADVLRLENFEMPRTITGGCAIENFATSINPIDINVRKGKLSFLTGGAFPKVLGSDFSGRLLSKNHLNLRPGAEVFGMLEPLKGGGYSQLVVAPPTHFIEKPRHLTIQESAAVPVAGLTAWEALVRHGKLREGRKIFINGCTGGVGSLSVQIAKAMGAKVTGTCSPRNADFARSLGVDLVIDYRQLSDSGLGGHDIVFDVAGTLPWKDFVRFGKPEARFATTGFSVGLVLRSFLRPALRLITVKPDHEALRALRTFLETHDIHPHISKECKLEGIANAHLDFEEKSHTGKVVIRIADPPLVPEKPEKPARLEPAPPPPVPPPSQSNLQRGRRSPHIR